MHEAAQKYARNTTKQANRKPDSRKGSKIPRGQSSMTKMRKKRHGDRGRDAGENHEDAATGRRGRKEQPAARAQAETTKTTMKTNTKKRYTNEEAEDQRKLKMQTAVEGRRRKMMTTQRHANVEEVHEPRSRRPRKKQTIKKEADDQEKRRCRRPQKEDDDDAQARVARVEERHDEEVHDEAED